MHRMRSRWRSAGLGVVMATAVGAVAIPAWADGPSQSAAPRPSASESGFVRAAGPPPALSEADQRRAGEELGAFVRCMRDRGYDLGEPEVGPDRVAIGLDGVVVDDAFHRAEEACGLPAPPGA